MRETPDTTRQTPGGSQTFGRRKTERRHWPDRRSAVRSESRPFAWLSVAFAAQIFGQAGRNRSVPEHITSIYGEPGVVRPRLRRLDRRI
jgi:hypothetical protein